jgi:hypothetical protein
VSKTTENATVDPLIADAETYLAEPGNWDYENDIPRDSRGLIERLLKAVQRMSAERVQIQENERVVTCVFCGHEYPPGTPQSNHEALKAHVADCEQHPAAAFNRERDAYQRAWDVAMGAIPLAAEIAEQLKSPDADAQQAYALGIAAVRTAMREARG